MNIAFYISNRINRKTLKGKHSKTMINVAVTSVALGVAVMIIAIAVLLGFQKQIKSKITDFNSNIKILPYSFSNNIEESYLDINDVDIEEINSLSEVKNVTPYCVKAGIIKTSEQIEGVAVKGINFNDDLFLKNYLDKGELTNQSDSAASNNIYISKNIADKLHIDLDDDIRIYFFVNERIRGRKLKVAGIYHSGLAEVDDMYVIADVRQIQKLNAWDENLYNGIDIFLTDINKTDEVAEKVITAVKYDSEIVRIQDLYPELFDWLKLLDTNVIIIIIVMAIVSSMAMISTFLILVLEKTNFIGILKSIGAKNKTVINIFLFNALYVLAKGLLYGNIIGIGLCLIQKYFKLLKLPSETYSIDFVPIDINILYFLIVNIFAIVICILMLLIPARVITKISPAKAVKIE
ncbi:MAG: FtsX-like permease family protein [Bacteroidales bacterium]